MKQVDLGKKSGLEFVRYFSEMGVYSFGRWEKLGSKIGHVVFHPGYAYARLACQPILVRQTRKPATMCVDNLSIKKLR